MEKAASEEAPLFRLGPGQLIDLHAQLYQSDGVFSP
jgi:hypothetical protein